jgi:ABC-type spermidine/putrescine transport system permease subunit II
MTTRQRQRANLVPRTVDRVSRAAVGLILWAAVIVMLVPVIMIFLLSFSDQQFIAFPPTEWGFTQYQELFAPTTPWLPATYLSFRVAIPAAVLAVLVGVSAALAVGRTRMRGGMVLRFAGLSSLIIPASAYAVAVYGVYADVGLLGNYWGLVLIHAILAVPVVLLIVSAALDQIPVQLELAAMSLGARQRRVWMEITLRLAAPSLAAAFIFSFILSFDESVLVVFLGGADLVTLPAAVFAAVTVGLDPSITAIATLLMGATAVLMTIAGASGRRRGRR